MAPELHSEALEQVFQDLAETARSAPSTHQFSEELVRATLAVTGASGAGVWMSEQGDLRGVFHLHLESLLSDEEALRTQEHVLRLALSTGRVQKALIAGRPELVLACPLPHGSDMRGALLLVLPSSAPAQRLDSVLEAVAGLSELSEDYFYCVANRNLANRVKRISQLEEFSHRLHRCQQRDSLCFEIAAALPNVANCDRVLVLTRRRGRLRLSAVTGVDTIDPRSETTIAAEQLATVVAPLGEPFWEGLPQDDHKLPLPPQLESVVAEYSETCHPRSLLVYPLQSDPKASGQQVRDDIDTFGALLLEWSKHCPDNDEQRDALRAAEHAKYALGKSLAQRWFRWSSGRWLVTRLAIVVGLMMLALGFFLQPVPFQLEARGTLEPKNRFHIFAPADGEVAELFVEHGDTVKAGDRLFQLRSLELERDLAELQGKQRELETRLKVLEVEALTTPQTIEEQQAAEALAAEEKQLREQLKGLATIAEIIHEQIEDLVARSPQHGKVVSWDLRHDWLHRQVRRGQPVLRVDDSEGPWVLELSLPERRYGHLQRQRESGDVDVSFRLASDPEYLRQGTLNDIGMRAEAGLDGQSYIPVTVQIPTLELPTTPRAGATVTARLDCGKRARGFVWFHQFAEYLRQRLFF